MRESLGLPYSDLHVHGREIVARSLVWDNHGCMPLRPDARFLPQLERYRNAGVNIVSLNVGFADMSWTEDLRVLSYMRQWIAKRPDRYVLVESLDDIHSCKQSGRLGIVFDIEGMNPVQRDPSLVQTFYELGVKWMLIAYNQNNAAGGGCLDADPGLTDIGRAILDEMERVGMVLCLSHTGEKTATEALEYRKSPTIFSHSNPYGDNPHSRNISDELIRACARRGGVVGLSGIGPYLGTGLGLVACLLRQIRYVVDLVGAEHVGLGLDYVFDATELDDYVRLNPQLFPPDLLNAGGGMAMIPPEAIEGIAECLARVNFSEAQISGILGGNWLRVAGQVWR